MIRKDVSPSLEKGGKRIKKLERKTITMRSPARTTATFGGLKNSKPSKRWELTFQQVWKVGEKESWTYDQ